MQPIPKTDRSAWSKRGRKLHCQWPMAGPVTFSQSCCVSGVKIRMSRRPREIVTYHCCALVAALIRATRFHRPSALGQALGQLQPLPAQDAGFRFIAGGARKNAFMAASGSRQGHKGAASGGLVLFFHRGFGRRFCESPHDQRHARSQNSASIKDRAVISVPQARGFDEPIIPRGHNRSQLSPKLSPCSPMERLPQ